MESLHFRHNSSASIRQRVGGDFFFHWWKRFQDDIFQYSHSAEDLNLFFNYMNNINRTKKIHFTMEVAEDVFEFRNIWKNLLVYTEFTSLATKRKDKIRRFSTSNTKNIIYLIVCKFCGKQYIGSATNFKERFESIKVTLIVVRLGVEQQATF